MGNVVLLLTLAAVPQWVGAAAAPSAFEPVAETRHVRYYSERRARIDVRSTEVFLSQLFSLFGPAPREWRMTYYRHATTDALSARIGFAAYGVTDIAVGRVDSSREYHPHELVHAVAGRLGRPPLLFSEGLAVALTTDGSWRGRDQGAVARAFVSERRNLRSLVADFGAEDAERDYAVAGSFVAFLLDRFGIDPLVTFLEACGPYTERYESALRAAYGGGLADLERGWRLWLASEGRESARPWREARSWPESLRMQGVRAVETADSVERQVWAAAASSALEYAETHGHSRAALPARPRKDD